jgi:hypothetical protein
MEDVVENRKMLREVTTVSRLYHRHIVRYYQAWLEGGSGSGAVSEDDDDDEGSDDDSEEWTSDEDTQESSDWMVRANRSAGERTHYPLLSVKQPYCEFSPHVRPEITFPRRVVYSWWQSKPQVVSNQR